MSARPNGWRWIRNFHICWTRVQTKLTDVRTVVFELWVLPYVLARLDGNPRRQDGCINLPLFELGKKIWSWSITGSRLDGLLRSPDGCKLEQKVLDTVKGPDEWCLVCLACGRYATSSGRLELEIDERQNGMTRRPNGWQGTDFSDLQNLLKHFWIAESLEKQHLYTQVILSKQNKANHKLIAEIRPNGAKCHPDGP
jgi:hypothetical protein